MINVHFQVLDRQRMSFVTVTEKMAKFLKQHQEYMRMFSDVLRNSAGWTCSNYRNELEDIKEHFKQHRKHAENDDTYLKLLNNIFHQANCDEDLEKIRGIAAEQILYCQVVSERKRNDGWKVETGCAVQVGTYTVSYRMETEEESKCTVDLGAWHHNQQMGRFIEAKVAPASFRKVDGNYLKCLRETFQQWANVKFKIYIFAIDQKELVRCAVSRAGYDIDANTEIIGREDIFQTNFLEIRSEAS